MFASHSTKRFMGVSLHLFMNIESSIFSESMNAPALTKDMEYSVSATCRRSLAVQDVAVRICCA